MNTNTVEYRVVEFGKWFVGLVDTERERLGLSAAKMYKQGGIEPHIYRRYLREDCDQVPTLKSMMRMLQGVGMRIDYSVIDGFRLTNEPEIM